LERLQFSPIVIQPGDALYIEYRGRDFTIDADFANGDRTAFDSSPQGSYEQWRKGILPLDVFRAALRQRLVRLRATANNPKQVLFRNIKIIRAGRPIFEFAKLASYGKPQVKLTVERSLPCVGFDEAPAPSPAAVNYAVPNNIVPKGLAGDFVRPMLPPFPIMVQSTTTSTDTNHYKFTGKELDDESGLYNYGARYYGPALGRYMTPDWSFTPTAVPYADFGNPQSLNLYSYAHNNPTTLVDPDGHCGTPTGLKPGQVGVCVASYIKAGWFGPGGRGDGRGPNGQGGTSRIETRLVVDPVKHSATKTNETINSSGIIVKDFGPQGKGGSTVSSTQTDKQGNTYFQVSQDAHSSYANILGVNVLGSIDNHLNLVVTPDDKVGIDPGSSARDFPSLEVFKYTVDDKGNVTTTQVFNKEESGNISDLKKPEKPIKPQAPK